MHTGSIKRTTVRQSSNLKCGGSINLLRSRKFRINLLPPDDFSIIKNDERNWFSLKSTDTMAPFDIRHSISASHANAPAGDKRDSARQALPGGGEMNGMR